MKKFGVFLVSFVCSMCFISNALAHHRPTPEQLREQMIQRIKPVWDLDIFGVEKPKPKPAVAKVEKAAPKKARSGKEVYTAHCAMCHGAGLAGAPKFGDKKAWKARIALGLKVLHKNAISGIRAMPPMGACSSCSKKEVENAVDYIVKHSK